MLMHNRGSGSGGGGGGGGGFMVMLRSALRSSMRVHAAASGTPFPLPPPCFSHAESRPADRPVPGSPFPPPPPPPVALFEYITGASLHLARESRPGCMPFHVNIKSPDGRDRRAESRTTEIRPGCSFLSASTGEGKGWRVKREETSRQNHRRLMTRDAHLVKETKRARVKTPAIRAVLQKALKNTALITVKQRSFAQVHPAPHPPRCVNCPVSQAEALIIPRNKCFEFPHRVTASEDARLERCTPNDPRREIQSVAGPPPFAPRVPPANS